MRLLSEYIFKCKINLGPCSYSVDKSAEPEMMLLLWKQQEVVVQNYITFRDKQLKRALMTCYFIFA